MISYTRNENKNEYLVLAVLYLINNKENSNFTDFS